jgi:signal transduction histidine kinase/ActR/RegA family two-component response regulator/HPt (histidine-containing phosphotransfer) domain-containing protein
MSVAVPLPLPGLQSLVRRGIARGGAILLWLGIIATLWAGLLIALAEQRDEARFVAARNAENLARVFADSSFQSFTAIDRSLLSLRAAYARNRVGFDIHDWMATSPPLTDLPSHFAITNRYGMVLATTMQRQMTGFDLSDREQFRVLRDSREDTLFIGKPVLGRAINRQVVILGRKLLAADGGFDGIVFASIETANLARFDAAVQLGPQGTVGLIGLDGIVRARGGGSAQPNDSSIGKSAAGSRLMQLVAQAPAGTFETVSVFDGVARIFAYRRVRDLPLVITVGIARAEAMARFTESARVQLGLGGGLTVLGLVILAMYLVRDRQMRRTADRLRAQFAEKSELLETTLEHMTQGILMVGADDRIQVFNQRFVEKFELPPALMQGQPVIQDVLRWLWDCGEYGEGGDFAAWSQALISQVRATQGLRIDEHTRPNGMVLEVRTSLLPNGGAVRTYNDITARKQEQTLLRAARDEADRATRAKSAFLATMSHEIRSPLSGLLGVLEMLRATSLDDEQRRMAGMIDNSGRLLLAVLNDVLDFSKIEAGALAIAPEPTALHALLEEAVQPHVGPGRHRGIAVRLAIDPAVPEYIATDPLRLRQILGNLLSNAMKFTYAGSVAVRAAFAPDDKAPMLRVVVRDSGIGMDADTIARLFQPFVQADGSTTRKFGGTGLGLSISQKLAGLMGGGLSVASMPGLGSEFSLILPVVACAAPPAASTGASAGATAASGPALPTGRRALLVDDDPTNRWLGQRQLQHLGFRVDVAEDGEAGLAAARAAPHDHPYDVVVTDLHMPRLDGVGLTLALRVADSPGLRDVPIIGLTADATATQRERCQAAGMTAVAIKPLTSSRLAALLADILPAAATPPNAVAAAPALRAVPFDSQIFLELFEPGDPEGAGWLGDYLATARAQVAELAGLPPDALVNAAHRLAGASFSVGAMTLGQAARALELAAWADATAPALAAPQAAVQAELAAAEAAIADFLRAPATAGTSVMCK